MSRSLVKAVALGFRYGATATLADIALDLAPGEVLGLIGPNGSGKSTLLKCLGSLHPISTGQLDMCGQPIGSYSRSALARLVAYVPQHIGTSMSLRVIDMVALGRFPYRGLCSAEENHRMVLDAVAHMHLEPLALRHFSELSGGERQRVLMARALAQQGQLLLLDEPTSDLDLKHQLGTLQAVRSIADNRGLGAVIALHDLSLAARFCDRLVMLHGGRIHAQGTWPVVLTAPGIEAVYGVKAKVGLDAGQPYVIASQKREHDANQ